MSPRRPEDELLAANRLFVRACQQGMLVASSSEQQRVIDEIAAGVHLPEAPPAADEDLTPLPPELRPKVFDALARRFDLFVEADRLGALVARSEEQKVLLAAIRSLRSQQNG